MDHRSVDSSQVLILLAPSFEETTFVYCLAALREAGFAVMVVGLAAGLLKGKHGLTVRPDCSLDQLASDVVPKLVIVPGGERCAALLLVDPRVHQLFARALAVDGYVAALTTADFVLAQAGIPTPADSEHFFVQNGGHIDQFVNKLIDLLY